MKSIFLDYGFLMRGRKEGLFSFYAYNSTFVMHLSTIFFGPIFLSQTPYVLRCIKCIYVTRTKCPIAMLKVLKSQIYGNFGPLIEHGPHWINFTIVIFISEKKKR
jgi:hypothetical protein